MVANSNLESVEAKILKLRKDLISAMDETNKANEKKKKENSLKPCVWRKRLLFKRMKRSKLPS